MAGVVYCALHSRIPGHVYLFHARTLCTHRQVLHWLSQQLVTFEHAVVSANVMQQLGMQIMTKAPGLVRAGLAISGVDLLPSISSLVPQL